MSCTSVCAIKGGHCGLSDYQALPCLAWAVCHLQSCSPSSAPSAALESTSQTQALQNHHCWSCREPPDAQLSCPQSSAAMAPQRLQCCRTRLPPPPCAPSSCQRLPATAVLSGAGELPARAGKLPRDCLCTAVATWRAATQATQPTRCPALLLAPRKSARPQTALRPVLRARGMTAASEVRLQPQAEKAGSWLSWTTRQGGWPAAQTPAARKGRRQCRADQVHSRSELPRRQAAFAAAAVAAAGGNAAAAQVAARWLSQMAGKMKRWPASWAGCHFVTGSAAAAVGAVRCRLEGARRWRWAAAAACAAAPAARGWLRGRPATYEHQCYILARAESSLASGRLLESEVTT